MSTRPTARETALRLGQVIRKRRVARGLSLRELGALVRTPRPLVSRAESGKHVLSLNSLERYANALEVKLSTLVREAEELAAHAYTAEATTHTSEAIE